MLGAGIVYSLPGFFQCFDRTEKIACFQQELFIFQADVFMD